MKPVEDAGKEYAQDAKYCLCRSRKTELITVGNVVSISQRKAKMISSGAEPLFKAAIPGRAMVLKNNKRIFGSGRHKRILPSTRYVHWEKLAMLYLNRSGAGVTMIDEPITAIYTFFLKDRSAEPDLSNLIEGISDSLQKARILKDDKLIMSLIAYKFFGAENPRTEIELFPYGKVPVRSGAV